MLNREDGDAVIELKIPVRAEYVHIARLTASGAANRVGFDIEAIEDIKVALSEVCNRIINILSKRSGERVSDCLIKFRLSKNSLAIEFHLEHAEEFGAYMTNGAETQPGDARDACADANDDRQMALCEDQIQLKFINVLMDEFVVNPNASCLVSMKKYVE